MAMHILMATMEALEIDADDFVLNRTSLQETREDNRKSQYDEAKAELIDNVMRILHVHTKYVYLS